MQNGTWMLTDEEIPLIYPLGHEQPPRLARRIAWRALTGDDPAPHDNPAPITNEPSTNAWWRWYGAVEPAEQQPPAADKTLDYWSWFASSPR